MLVVLDAASRLPTSSTPDQALAAQLEAWKHSRPGDTAVPPAILHLGVATWTRLHGAVSLEIEGVFDSTGLDPELVYDAEVAHLVSGHALSTV